MLLLLSPAKSLDTSPPPAQVPHTLPLMLDQSAQLIEVLRQQSPQQIASLMHLSDALAGLNVARYAAWSPRCTADNAKQAVLAFNGDVYEGLTAANLALADLDWLQSHLCILSGLYGVLRPLDWMQPYRLEMGTKLNTARAANLYQFWGDRIAQYLNQRLADEAAPVVVNLASQEYFKAVNRKVLRAPVLDCVFEDYKSGQYKIISFYAKRARGLMARYAATHRLSQPAQLQSFDLEGYSYAPAASQPDLSQPQARLVFRRRLD
jgi:cytoplasmic iron level regulating protein YaaA (DUF328/UPF0246 family)